MTQRDKTPEQMQRDKENAEKGKRTRYENEQLGVLKGQSLQDAAEQRQKDLAKRGLEMSINSIKVSLLLETATAEDHAKHELERPFFGAALGGTKVKFIQCHMEYDDLPTEAEREVYRVTCLLTACKVVK